MIRTRLVPVILGAALAVSALAGSASATTVGSQGCTPGYWKNHTTNWPQLPTDSGYKPDRALNTVFVLPASLKLGNPTMLNALEFKGGPDLSGAARNLLRAATASVLNADHEGVSYPLRRFDGYRIIPTVNAALASGSRSTMLGVASFLDSRNNLGCPLNNTVWRPAA